MDEGREDRLLAETMIKAENENTLTIQVHSMANARFNRAVQHLLEQLNSADFNYPGTCFKLVYRMAAPVAELR